MTRQGIDAILEAAIAGGKLPGVVALAGTRDQVIYSGAAGLRDVSGASPMTPDTVMWIASMTKAVTSVAALQLVEEGRLSLDSPIGEVLPAYAAPLVLDGYSEDGRAMLRSAAAPITLRHLLTHTAGFAYEIWDGELQRFMREAGIPETTSRLNASRAPLRFEPGSRWIYGTGVDVAGHAIEAVTGEPLGQILRQRITEPLDMPDTGFVITPDMEKRLAPIHRRAAGGGFTAIDLRFPRSPGVESGGGGLYSTMSDYLRFLRMLLAGGALDGVRVLSQEMTALAMRNQTGPVRVTALQSAMPELSADLDFLGGPPKGWGLIGMVNEQATGTGRSAGSIGWAGLANTYWWIDGRRAIAAVIGTQLLPFADPLALEVAGDLERALQGLQAR
jgi:CubicO group peptidase (beta-lactamase class C family)